MQPPSALINAALPVARATLTATVSSTSASAPRPTPSRPPSDPASPPSLPSPLPDFSTLPPDILAKIFQFLINRPLSSQLTLLSFSLARPLLLASPLFAAAFHARVKHVTPWDFGYVDRSALLLYLAKYTPDLRSLDLTVLSCKFTRGSMRLDIAPRALQLLAENCPLLEKLTLTSCYVSPRAAQAFPNMQSLTFLDLSYTTITDEVLQPVRRCRRLQTLDLSECSELTDAGIASLRGMRSLLKVYVSHGYKLTDGAAESLAGCEFICLLDVAHCGKVTDYGVQAVSNGMKHLQIAYLTGCSKLTDGGVSCLTRCKELKNLDLSFCSAVTDEGMKWMGYMYSLEILTLSGCANVSAAGVASLSRLKKLHTINLSACNKLTDDVAPELLKLKALISIDLSFCIHLTDETPEILRAHPSLATLNLQRCTGLSPAGVSSLATCTTIESLFLGGVPRVTDGVVVDLTALQNIKMLYLDRNELLTDRSAYAIGTMGSLEHLFLKGCPLLSDLGVTAISRLGASLKILNIAECERLTDKAVEMLCAGCKELKNLDISSNNFGDEAAKHLVSLKNLENLNMSECNELTDRGCMFIGKMTSLQILTLSKCSKITRKGAIALTKLTGLKAIDVHFKRVPKDLLRTDFVVEFFSLRDSNCAEFLLFCARDGWMGGPVHRKKPEPFSSPNVFHVEPVSKRALSDTRSNTAQASEAAGSRRIAQEDEEGAGGQLQIARPGEPRRSRQGFVNRLLRKLYAPLLNPLQLPPPG